METRGHSGGLFGGGGGGSAMRGERFNLMKMRLPAQWGMNYGIFIIIILKGADRKVVKLQNRKVSSVENQKMPGEISAGNKKKKSNGGKVGGGLAADKKLR